MKSPFEAQVVLAPVALGAALNQWFPRAVRRTAPFAPLVRLPLWERMAESGAS
jgi:predicted Na+-dependent transporter